MEGKSPLDMTVREFIKLAKEHKHTTKHAIKLVRFAIEHGSHIIVGNRMVKVVVPPAELPLLEKLEE